MPTIRSFIVPVLGTLFMVVYLLDVEYVSSMRGLDLSWHTMLGYAHETRLQHGSQIIFNYGPLSFIESAVYFEQTHAEKLAWRAVYLTILAVGCFSVLRIRSALALLAWSALTLLLLMLRDVYLLLPALLLCHHETHRQPGNGWQLLLSLLLAFAAAFACLVKSNALFFTVPAIVLASLYRFSLRDWRPIVPACFVLCAVLLYWLSGQELSGFLEFLHGYADVSRAYNEDMGLPAKPVLHLAFAAGAVVVATTLNLRGRTGAVLGALTLGYLLVAYKMGFVRHGAHAYTAFLALAWICAVQLWSPASHWRNRNHRRVVAITAMAAAAYIASSPLLASLLPHGQALQGYASVVQHRFRYVLDPAFRAASDAEGRRRFALARTGAQAAIPFQAIEGPIDVFPFEFSLAYASGLPIATRPAFQSYFATSRHMTQRNADFLAGPQAPRSVVFSIFPMDGRYAALEDPMALDAYRRQYQVDRQTPHALLLTRRAPALAQSQSCTDTEVGFGQPIAVPEVAPDQAVWAQLALAPDWVGRIAGVIGGPPVLRMAVTTPGGSTDFRFLREAGEVGFLLSPALVSTEAAARFFQGESRPQDRVLNLAIHQPDGPVPWYGPRISARLCVLSWRQRAADRQVDTLLN